MPRDSAPPKKRALVCVLGLRGIPGVMGGVEAHCEELLPRIAANAPDLEVELIARRPYSPEPTSVGQVRVTPLFSPRRQSTEAIVSTLLGLIYAKRRGADTVHIHAIGPALLAPLGRALGMKVILTHHGADYDRQKWGFFAKTMLRLGEQVGIRSANAVIVVAPSLGEVLKARFPAHQDKIRYVPNGKTYFPPIAANESILSDLGLKRGNYVLAVGRLVPEKGFHTLIDAIRKSGSKRKLVIVGGAQHESDYSKALLDQASKDVIFAGVQGRAALHELYTNAAMFVLPSTHEGLPICALEAGSLGCPLLLSDIPGNLDIGLPESHYFAAGDVEDLSEALRVPPGRYAVSPEMFSAFDWDQISRNTLAIYNSVIGSEASLDAA